MRSVGIEAITAYVPRFCLDLKALARANGHETEKIVFGLGGRRMAVPAPQEDTVTMAAEAAARLLERYDVALDDIGLLVAGSESGVDAAKPVAAHVHGLLGLSPACRSFDTQHGCFGGTAGLVVAANWCRVGAGGGRKALVIGTDISRYAAGTSAEATQGAGAVAMLVGDKPDVLALDGHPDAVYTQDVMDFWRPHGQATASPRDLLSSDGPLTVDRYLHAVEFTWRTHRLMSGLAWDDYDRLLFHAPFPKMAFKALRRVHDHEVQRLGGGEGLTPLDEAFEQRTLPALWANAEVGNLHCGALYLSLAALLDGPTAELPNAQVGLFSYGSGCCGEFFSGRIGPDPAVWQGRVGVQEALAGRQELTHAEYMAFRERSVALAQPDADVQLDDAFPPGSRFAFCGLEEGRRVYRRDDGGVATTRHLRTA